MAQRSHKVLNICYYSIIIFKLFHHLSQNKSKKHVKKIENMVFEISLNSFLKYQNKDVVNNCSQLNVLSVNHCKMIHSLFFCHTLYYKFQYKMLQLFRHKQIYIKSVRKEFVEFRNESLLISIGKTISVWILFARNGC